MSSSTPMGLSKAAAADHTVMAAPKTIPSRTEKKDDAKNAASKQHRRSRSGCFTCRLRRKKCDEVKPLCKACKHLGLKCDYKRPVWWGNNEARRDQKDRIKEIIKHTQINKKQISTTLPPIGSHTPPGLCHSVPTSDFSDSLPFSHSRAASIDQSPSLSEHGYPGYSSDGYFGFSPAHHPVMLPNPQYPMFSPYEVDIKTERQIFINDVPTRRDSTISTFSTFQPPPSSSDCATIPEDMWVQQNHFESSKELFPNAEEPVDFEFFQYPHGQLTPTHESLIQVNEEDRPLLDHFLEKVMKLIFPVLDANQHGSARSDIVLPALETNRCYLHCCLSVAAVHKKATQKLSGEQIDGDILRHRYDTVTALCESMDQEHNYLPVLEATLAVIFFQSCVGRPDDILPDIPWHNHLQSATDLVQQLELPQQLMSTSLGAPPRPPFNMTLSAWIDILGATMLGRSPTFADTYRDLNIGQHSAGLAELMGCDDKIMFLISEIACLEARKLEGMDEVMLCRYIEILGTEISLSEPAPGSIQSAISATGAIRPKQLTINMTAVFRIAARIYLCSMVPGFNIHAISTVNLVESFCEAMDFIPAGAEGFDRSLVWPVLIAGAVSTAGSRFRTMFAERCARLGEAQEFGSFGRVRELLSDIWVVNDDPAVAGPGGCKGVHWRSVMLQKGWDCLLI